MKWIWVSMGVALIVAITVICCFMICVGNYACSCFVWALYVLLIAYLVSCKCLIKKKIEADSIEKKEERQCKADEAMQKSFVSEVMKSILALQKELDEIKYTIKTNVTDSKKQ